jgi:hypothetical protein
MRDMLVSRTSECPRGCLPLGPVQHLPVNRNGAAAPTHWLLCHSGSHRTFNKFVCWDVVAFQPRFESSSADRADRVTRMRYQELLFCASVLGAAIALHNCPEPDVSISAGNEFSVVTIRLNGASGEVFR